MRIKRHTHGTHFNIHEGVDSGEASTPSPTPTPCLRPPLLNRAKFPFFPPSLSLQCFFSLSYLLFSSLPNPHLPPPAPSSPTSLLPCPPPHTCCWNIYLHVFCFTTDDIKQKLYSTHIFVLVYCIVNPTWGISWFYCRSFLCNRRNYVLV